MLFRTEDEDEQPNLLNRPESENMAMTIDSTVVVP